MSIICLECIGDEALRERLKPLAKTANCTYCAAVQHAVTIEDLAESVDEPFRLAYGLGEVSPRFYNDSDSSYWEQDGDDLNSVLQQEVEIGPEAADALIDALSELDPADPRDGDEPFYDTSQNYQRVDIYDWEYAEAWTDFSERLKHRRRFFDTEAAEQLAAILGAPGSLEASELPAALIGPESDLPRVFRARRADTADVARRMLSNPSAELCPPPAYLTPAGRMNSAGIPVLYGAFSEAVAVAEVRPAVGGLVVVGSFMVTRPRRLLDLTRLGSSRTGSIFAPGYADRAARLRFLQSFHYLVTRPVQPAEESREYLPTQAVAEYVGSVLGFDGVMYGSAQFGELDEIFHPDDMRVPIAATECNVVLFRTTYPEFGSAGCKSPYYAEYEQNSVRGVWVTKLEYKYQRVNLDDERGDF